MITIDYIRRGVCYVMQYTKGRDGIVGVTHSGFEQYCSVQVEINVLHLFVLNKKQRQKHFQLISVFVPHSNLLIFKRICGNLGRVLITKTLEEA